MQRRGYATISGVPRLRLFEGVSTVWMGEFSETRLVQAKYSGDAGRSYRASGVARNEAADGRLDRVLLEALSGQVAGGRRRPASLRSDPLGAHTLRLQRGESGLGRLGADALALEIVADRGVAEAAIREGCRSPRGKPR